MHQINYTQWHRSPGPSGPPGTYGPPKPPLSPDIKSAKIYQIFQTSWTSNTTLIAESKGVKVAYHTRAIIRSAFKFFIPFFTAVYNQEQLILKTIYVVNKKILQKIPRFIIKSGFKARAGCIGACAVDLVFVTTSEIPMTTWTRDQGPNLAPLVNSNVGARPNRSCSGLGKS